MKRVLFVVELAALVGWVAVAGWATWGGGEDGLPALDVAAIAAGPAEEQWMGLFQSGQHVGYSVSSEAPTADGGRLFQQKMVFKLASMGEVQQILTAGTALTDPEGRVRRFDFVLSAPTRIAGAGEWKDGKIVLDLVQSGTTTRLEFAVPEPPVIGQTFGTVVRGRTLTPGTSWEVPYFDPIQQLNTSARVSVEAPELLPNGDTAYWLRTRVSGFETRRLVGSDGAVLREEGGMGLSAVRMPRGEAIAIDAADPPDLVGLSAVPAEGPPPRGSRSVFEISGIELDRVPSEPPLQTRDGATVVIDVPLDEQLVAGLPIEGAGDTEASLSLPATHPEIVARADALVAGATDRLAAVRAIHAFVASYVQKVPTIGIPNGLEVLRSGRGDCNEHTALFVSLTRAAGIPSRIAAGLVYNASLGDAFYYHAWPEVRLGPTDSSGQPGWVPVDPTLRQFPADASHLKLVTGDLDRQVEIMGVMGRIRVKVVE